MKKVLKSLLLCLIVAGTFLVSAARGQEQDIISAKSQEPVKDNRQTIKAIYIPLADHYPGIVAYEKYRDQMTKLASRLDEFDYVFPDHFVYDLENYVVSNYHASW